MTIAAPRRVLPNHRIVLVACLLSGLAVSVAVRIIVGNGNVAHSAVAGLAFAACLLVLSAAAGISVKVTRRAIVIGLLGGIFLCIPAVVAHISGVTSHQPMGSYLSWSCIVGVVALAEEIFLRGVLFDAVMSWRGEHMAVIISAVAFALLHIPLYGWSAIPLDFVVGLWLGSLRAVTGIFWAPATAHILADLFAWWL